MMREWAWGGVIKLGVMVEAFLLDPSDFDVEVERAGVE